MRPAPAPGEGGIAPSRAAGAAGTAMGAEAAGRWTPAAAAAAMAGRPRGEAAGTAWPAPTAAPEFGPLLVVLGDMGREVPPRGVPAWPLRGVGAGVPCWAADLGPPERRLQPQGSRAAQRNKRGPRGRGWQGWGGRRAGMGSRPRVDTSPHT